MKKYFNSFQKVFSILGFLVLVQAVSLAQEKSIAVSQEIRLNSRHFVPNVADAKTAELRSSAWHGIIQFDEAINQDAIDGLRKQGLEVLHVVPDNAVMASIPPSLM